MEIIASLGSLAIGVVILYIIVKLLALPFKLVWNGIIGAVMLWLANLLGGALFNVKIHITIIKALIAGFFGIPGAAAVILWRFTCNGCMDSTGDQCPPSRSGSDRRGDADSLGSPVVASGEKRTGAVV